MLRAMDSAVSGLRAHQNKLDVISNNIANVNTYGFKAQSYSFKDTMYQTSNGSTSGALKSNNGTTVVGVEEKGGINGAQYGYGSLTGSIATDFTSSTPTYIGGFNASINGSGFFITNKENITDGIGINTKGDESDNTYNTTKNMKDKTFSYTRVGQLKVDSEGYIVDSNGYFVYGFRPDKLQDPKQYGGGDAKKTLYALRAPDKIQTWTDDMAGTYTGTAQQLKSIEIGNDGKIKAIIEVDVTTNGETKTEEKAIVIGRIAIASFQNQEGLMKAGNNTFNAAKGDNTGKVGVNEANVGATPSLMAGYLEGSNVDLAKEFSDMITTQRGFQANSKIITVSDEVLQELVNMKR